MSSFQIEIIIIASLIAVSCSLIGTYLVLKKMAMLTDAITHTVLLGIVIGYLITNDLNSPLLYLGAILIGILTVYLVELFNDTGLLSQESAIGVVYPFLFSLAVVLINQYASSAHLDTDAVLLGELAFAPLDRITIFSWNIPRSMLTGLVILVLNIFFIIIFFKELKLSSFDYILASAFSFSPLLLNYLLMTFVSITAVNAFSALGSILVVSFMIGPGLSAYLLSDKLHRIFIYGALIAIFNVILGYFTANILDVSIAGSMAFITGLTFLITFFFSKKGYFTTLIRRRRQKQEFTRLFLLGHLYNHKVDEVDKNRLSFIKNNLKLKSSELNKTLNYLLKKDLVVQKNETLSLTQRGEAYFKNSFLASLV